MSEQAVLEQPKATESESAPGTVDLVSTFYGSPKSANDSPTTVATPAPKVEPGPSDTPKASSDSATKAKPGDSPKGTEKEKSDEGGHVAAARRLGNEVKELKTRLESLSEENTVLKSKLDGSYKEPEQPSPEVAAKIAEFKGREVASRQLAFDRYGEDRVRESIYGVDKDGNRVEGGGDYEQLVRRKPWVQLEVRESAQPTMAAMRVLAREAFLEKYGDDPTLWHEKIAAEIEPDLLKKFEESMKKTPVGKEPPTVSEGRGGGGSERERSLTDVFYGKGA